MEKLFEATIKNAETNELLIKISSYSQLGLEEEMGKQKWTKIADAKELKTYELYIKSHGEEPDYEDSVEAENKWQAAYKFVDRMAKGMIDPETDKYYANDWDAESLTPYIEENAI